MKQQTTGLLLCALLLSTFGHEHLRNHYLHQQNRIGHGSHHVQNRQQPPAPSSSCEWVCPPTPSPPITTLPPITTTTSTSAPIITNSTPGEVITPEPITTTVTPTGPTGVNVTITANLTLIINTTTNIIAIVNTTAQVSIVIDIAANLVAVFNGTSGAVVILNIQTQAGIVISGGVWLSANVSFAAYLNTISSLTVVWQLGLRIGTSFTQATQQALQIVAGVLVHISYQYALQIQGSISVSVTILLQVSARVTAVFNGSLRGFLQLVGSGTVVMAGNIEWFVGVLEGIGGFISQINGGIQVVIQKSIRFDLQVLFAARTGFELFIYLYKQISVQIDISSVLAGFSTNIQAFLLLIVNLSGNTTVGVSGFVNVIYSLVAASNNQISVSAFIDVFINYVTSRRTDVNVTVQFYSAIDVFLNFTSSLNSTTSISAFVSTLTSIREQRWIVGRINISQIIVIIGNVQVQALDVIIRALVAIRTVIQIEITIAILFLRILQYLNTSIGVAIVNQLIPSLRLDVNINIVAYIRQNINLSAIVAAGVNIVKLIQAIPIVGDIYVALNASLSSSSQGSLSLSVIFQSSAAGSIVAQIWAWFSSVLRINVGGGGGVSVSGGGGGGGGGGVTVSGGSGGGFSWGWSGKHHAAKEKHHAGLHDSETNRLHEHHHEQVKHHQAHEKHHNDQ